MFEGRLVLFLSPGAFGVNGEGASASSANVAFSLSSENQPGIYAKRVYIWFRDSAGNLSDGTSDSTRYSRPIQSYETALIAFRLREQGLSSTLSFVRQSKRAGGETGHSKDTN